MIWVRIRACTHKQARSLSKDGQLKPPMPQRPNLDEVFADLLAKHDHRPHAKGCVEAKRAAARGNCRSRVPSVGVGTRMYTDSRPPQRMNSFLSAVACSQRRSQARPRPSK